MNITPLMQPKTSTIPIFILLTALAPVANNKGIAPAAVDKLVIIIGLKRIFAASIVASRGFFPSAINWFANSTIRIPCFADNPISISKAI